MIGDFRSARVRVDNLVLIPGGGSFSSKNPSDSLVHSLRTPAFRLLILRENVTMTPAFSIAVLDGLQYCFPSTQILIPPCDFHVLHSSFFSF